VHGQRCQPQPRRTRCPPPSRDLKTQPVRGEATTHNTHDQRHNNDLQAAPQRRWQQSNPRERKYKNTTAPCVRGIGRPARTVCKTRQEKRRLEGNAGARVPAQYQNVTKTTTTQARVWRMEKQRAEKQVTTDTHVITDNQPWKGTPRHPCNAGSVSCSHLQRSSTSAAAHGTALWSGACMRVCVCVCVCDSPCTPDRVQLGEGGGLPHAHLARVTA
jgi:hypothetical protein